MGSGLSRLLGPDQPLAPTLSWDFPRPSTLWFFLLTSRLALGGKRGDPGVGTLALSQTWLAQPSSSIFCVILAESLSLLEL